MLGKKYFPLKCKKNIFNNKLSYPHYEEIFESHMLFLTCICSFSNLPRSSDGVTWGGKDSFDPFTVCSSAVQTQRSAAKCCVTAGLVRHSTAFYFRQEKSGGNMPRVILLSKIPGYLHCHEALTPKELAKETQFHSVALK